MRLAGAFTALSLLLTPPVLASGAPVTSIRPTPRATTATISTRTSDVLVYYRYETRPRPRGIAGQLSSPAVDTVAVLPASTPQYQMATTVPVFSSIRPHRRPTNLGRRALTPSTRVATAAPRISTGIGKMCGDRRIKGQIIAPIVGEKPGCGVAKPVRISSIDGVVLSQASIMDCRTAKALTTWVTRGLKPAVGRKGGGVKSLRVVSHYACRTRNSKAGAKISEHGKGHAIDIAAINLSNGQQITVLDGWRSRKDSKLLKKLHSSACGTFGTVLGPEANKYHQDHFHFDTARYRSGPFCE